MPNTFHRRPLPDDLIDFGAPVGRQFLTEALAAGDAEAFFALVAHLHTQAEPAWCGLGTLVTVLNALQIDPGRTWKGPWRFFGEELLVCCKSLELATAEGLSIDEVACLASCNGAQAEVYRSDDVQHFREELLHSVRSPNGPFLVANYGRRALGQTGDGHFSPLAAWHAPSDHVLILDVARFKYPPHWVPVERLVAAMRTPDSASGLPRGWLSLAQATKPQRLPPPGATELLARLQSNEVSCCVPSLPQ